MRALCIEGIKVCLVPTMHLEESKSIALYSSISSDVCSLQASIMCKNGKSERKNVFWRT